MLLGITCLLFRATYVQSYNQSLNCSDPHTPQGYAPEGSPDVLYCDLNKTLRNQLLDKFDIHGENNEGRTFIDLIGQLVRLIFHDCFGPKENDLTVPAICDGCIDFDHPKHAGLEHDAIGEIEQMYKSDWQTRMNRSDFWAACATIALQESVQLFNASWRLISDDTINDTLPYIPFYVGRKDCSASPDINIENYENTKWDPEAANGTGAEIVGKSFGDATGGFKENFAVFQEGFVELKPREYVALLGVHTLGIFISITGLSVSDISNVSFRIKLLSKSIINN